MYVAYRLVVTSYFQFVSNPLANSQVCLEADKQPAEPDLFPRDSCDTTGKVLFDAMPQLYQQPAGESSNREQNPFDEAGLRRRSSLLMLVRDCPCMPHGQIGEKRLWGQRWPRILSKAQAGPSGLCRRRCGRSKGGGGDVSPGAGGVSLGLVGGRSLC